MEVDEMSKNYPELGNFTIWPYSIVYFLDNFPHDLIIPPLNRKKNPAHKSRGKFPAFPNKIKPRN